MTEPLFVFAKITPKPAHLSDAAAAIEGIAEETRAESGCARFELMRGDEDGCLYLFEEWVNDAALQAHYATSYTKAVFAAYEDWLEKPVEVTKMRKAG